MKKIFLLFVAACAVLACDPVHEDIKNDGHITVDELIAKTSVTVDKAASGQNGNVITCTTSAPVNAKWTIAGKEYIGNYAWKKMKLGEHTITMTAICADGTELTANFPVSCQEITDPLEKYYIYQGEPFTLVTNGDGGPGRFSDNEGKYLPYLSDDIYFGLKTLIFEVTDVKEGPFIWGDGVSDVGCTARIMTGWWDPVFADNVPISVGLWELPITEDMAKACASGGDNKDLDILMTRGSITIKSVYYEE